MLNNNEQQFYNNDLQPQNDIEAAVVQRKIEDLEGQIVFLRDATKDKKIDKVADDYIFGRIIDLQNEINKLQLGLNNFLRNKEIVISDKDDKESIEKDSVEHKAAEVIANIDTVINTMETDFGEINNSDIEEKVAQAEEIANITKDEVQKIKVENKDSYDFSNIEASWHGLHELLNILRNKKIVNSSGYEYSSDEIIQIVSDVVEGTLDINKVPRIYGLRDKVDEIKEATMKEREEENNNKEKNKPTGVSRERIAELREKLKIFKEKRERFLTLKLKLEQSNGIFINNRESKKLFEEFKKASSEYHLARIEYIADKVNRFANERLKVVEFEAEKVIEYKKSNVIKEKYHKIVDSFYDNYKKLGKINLTDKLFINKLAKNEQDGKIKKTLKWLGRFGGKIVSARLAVSFGLVGGGILLAGSGAGALAVVPLALRRMLSGVGATIGSYDLQRQFGKDERQIRKIEKMNSEEFKKMSQGDLEKYLNHYEVDAIINGGSATESKVYRKLRLEYTQRLRKEQENRDIKDKKEKVLNDFLSSKMYKVDKELEGLKKDVKFRNTRKKILALGIGVFVGSGVAFDLGKKLFFGVKDFFYGSDHVTGAHHDFGQNLENNLKTSKTIEHDSGNNNLNERLEDNNIKHKDIKVNTNDTLDKEVTVVEDIDYQGGRNIWDEISKQMDARAQGSFKKVLEIFNQEGEGARTYAIDYLKDKIVNNPEAYGLSIKGDVNINDLSSEQLKNIDWNKLLSEGLDNVDKMTPNLSEEVKNSIIENNKIIKNLNQNGLIKNWDKVDDLVKQVKEKFNGDVGKYKEIKLNQEINQRLQEKIKKLIIKPINVKVRGIFDQEVKLTATDSTLAEHQQTSVIDGDVNGADDNLLKLTDEHINLDKNKVVSSDTSVDDGLDKHSNADKSIDLSKGDNVDQLLDDKKIDKIDHESNDYNIQDVDENEHIINKEDAVDEKIKEINTDVNTDINIDADTDVDVDVDGDVDVEINTGNKDILNEDITRGHKIGIKDKVGDLVEGTKESVAARNKFFDNLEKLIGTKYSVGKDGLDCMTLIRKAGKNIKNNILENYDEFMRTHSGNKLTFDEFLKGKEVAFRHASWDTIKEKIKPGDYLLNLNSPGGVTYGPEGHGAILRVVEGLGGEKKFTMIHASTAAIEVNEQEMPISLHELKIKVDGNEYSGRKIVTSFAKKFKDFMHTASDSSRIYDKSLVSRMKFFDKFGHEIHPKLQPDGSLRLGHVTKEVDLDSYFKYNKDFSKNITALKI